MHSLNRNTQKIYYAEYTGKEPIRDAYGNLTGEYEVSYSEPKEYWINVSIAARTAFAGDEIKLEEFGINSNYQRNLVTCDMNCPIMEDSVLWVGIEPTREVNGETVPVEHNFVIARKSISLNGISFAIREVNLS